MQDTDRTTTITEFFACHIQRHGTSTLVVFAVVSVIGLAGITRLTVENRFIDYYRKSTEIYQGMELIDRELGGTTPLDVIIDAPACEADQELAAEEDFEDFDDEFLDIYGEEDEGEGEAGIAARSHWFNSCRIGDVIAVHDYLDSLHESGKVVSLASIARILEQLDPEVLEDNFELSVIYERLEPDLRKELFAPYLSEDGSQIRFSVRVFESDPAPFVCRLRIARFASSIADSVMALDAASVPANAILPMRWRASTHGRRSCCHRSGHQATSPDSASTEYA